MVILVYSKVGLGDMDYIAIFQQVLMPIAYEVRVCLNKLFLAKNKYIFSVTNLYSCIIQFNPEFVLVLAGCDNAVGDPERQMEVTPAAFGHIIHMLKSLACGKIFVMTGV